MPVPQSPHDGYPWSQLTLVPPHSLSLRFDVHLTGAEDTAQVSVTTTDGPDGDLIGMEVAHVACTPLGFVEAANWLAGYLSRSRAMLSPF